MPEHMEVILRSITSFGTLLIGAKILGKQTISQMTMFDFVAAISLGAISANLAFNTSIKVHHTIIALCIYVLVIFIIAINSLKSKKAISWRPNNCYSKRKNTREKYEKDALYIR